MITPRELNERELAEIAHLIPDPEPPLAQPRPLNGERGVPARPLHVCEPLLDDIKRPVDINRRGAYQIRRKIQRPAHQASPQRIKIFDDEFFPARRAFDDHRRKNARVRKQLEINVAPDLF